MHLYPCRRSHSSRYPLHKDAPEIQLGARQIAHDDPCDDAGALEGTSWRFHAGIGEAVERVAATAGIP